MDIPLFVVDAFTDRPFHGNPAAVCPLETWLPDDLMQAIAAENNLSETAFLVPAGDGWELRWFTPQVEVDLCGHATLATAFVLAMDPATAREQYVFHTRSGALPVRAEGDWLVLDFPARALAPVAADDPLQAQVLAALGLNPLSLTRAAATVIAEVAAEDTVKALAPDMAVVLVMDCKALIVTAPGQDCDFVSRFFAPKVGINEDPVTGSAHCGLIPYWHGKTGKTDLLARQVSPRGGELRCRLDGERVAIGGRAVLFSRGKITV